MGRPITSLSAFARLINILANNWMTFPLQMLPNLMKARNISLTLQQLKAPELLLDLINRTGRQPSAGTKASTQRNANNALNGIEIPSGHGQVLFDQTAPKLATAVNRQTFGYQADPRRAQVNTVYQPGSWQDISPGELANQAIHQTGRVLVAHSERNRY